MASDSEYSSTSSDDADKRRKHKSSKSKKQKKIKKQKKEKQRHKEKKRRRTRHSSSSSCESESEVRVQPTIQTLPALPNIANNVEEVDAASFGPALPPHLIKTALPAAPAPTIIGPIMPSDFIRNTEEPQQNTNEGSNSATSCEEEDLAECFGPLPTAATTTMTAQQVELEQRALELKIAAISGGSTSTNTDQKEREEWMLELPEVGLKGGLAALNNMKRKFHQGKEKPDFSDRSSWTKTPQSEAQAKQKPPARDIVQDAEAEYARQRDAEQERIAKKHKKKHKREESLVEIHQKKLRKEQRKKEKELAASGAKPERRPFTRDVDLKLNKIDSNQTKQIVNKAKILNTKFSSGHTKYL